MRKTFTLLLVLLVSPLASTAMHAPTTIESPSVIANIDTDRDRSDLQLALRDLWAEHIFWVRSVVIANYYEDEAAAGAAHDQAVANARAIANAVAPLYGQKASDQLFELLAGHYGAIAEYMQAGLAGNSSGRQAASDEIIANAEKIADFLDAANPYLPKKVVLPMLATHGSHHMQQIDAIAGENFQKEAEIWSAMKDHIYALADAMAGAFAKQFPDKVGN